MNEWIFENIIVSILLKILPVGAEFHVDERADIRSFANVPKNICDVLWRFVDILAEGCCDNDGFRLPLIVQEHLGGGSLLFRDCGLFVLLR